MSISKEQKLDMQSHHSAMSMMKPSNKAKEWFRRPPYSIKRSGASGQENIESVSSIIARDSETEKGH